MGGLVVIARPALCSPKTNRKTLTHQQFAPPTVYIDDDIVDTDPEADDDDDDDIDAQQRRRLRAPEPSSTGSTMADDRSSIYLDTISLASDFPAAGINNRKSISMSRQTIYHSAEDLSSGGDSKAPTLPPTLPPTAASSAGEFLSHMRETPRQNGGSGGRSRNGGLKGGADATDGGIAAMAAPLANDEVSAEALLGSNKTVTYSEWKSRVNQICVCVSGPPSRPALLPSHSALCLCASVLLPSTIA